VEQMKITPDEDVFVSYGERAKVGDFLEKRGIAQKIKQACENIANYRNIPEKPKTIEDIQKPKEIFFGYTYNEDGEYKDKVILEGKSAVAKFVANTDENLNRVITNVKKQYLITTLGNSIYKFAPEVRTKDREEFQKLLEEEIDALSKDDEER
jgi:ketol-acid reductoisomerase